MLNPTIPIPMQKYVCLGNSNNTMTDWMTTVEITHTISLESADVEAELPALCVWSPDPEREADWPPSVPSSLTSSMTGISQSTSATQQMSLINQLSYFVTLCNYVHNYDNKNNSSHIPCRVSSIILQISDSLPALAHYCEDALFWKTVFTAAILVCDKVRVKCNCNFLNQHVYYVMDIWKMTNGQTCTWQMTSWLA